VQETRGWDEAEGETFTQRVKEEADDYRYFPEPDLPPLEIETQWLETLRASLPELPAARFERFQEQYGLSAYDAGVLTAEPSVAEYFEQTLRAASQASPKLVANWITGDLFGLLNQAGTGIEEAPVNPQSLADLVGMVAAGEINQNTAKAVLSVMFAEGKSAHEIVAQRGLRQISDEGVIAGLVGKVIEQHPEQVATYLGGKESVARWLFGQVMRLASNQANPQMVQRELENQLGELKQGRAGTS
jgi:aspartyl-tRNA(Asn)/glutamyl-tRNA(Gln) amidotransferase subunit B